ncbi:LysR substrate-binding domain-containing protein [Pseudomonas sp. REB1044]|uniref:LysR family transcriptional regulator n=1 Tax=Pseudomonas sp. REB1044 TaxID=2675224 RepID=UPI00315DE087
MDTFAAIKAFVTTVEHGGFAPAARHLEVATSSVIRQVDSLERHLATFLLHRTTRKVSLTAAGEVYYEHAQRLLTDLESAHREVAEADGPPTGLLRVSLPVAFGQLHVAPILHRFIELYPGISLDIDLNDHVVDLAAQRLDLSVRLGGINATNVIAHRLAPHTRLLCASPAYLLKHGIPENPIDLEQHRCLRFSYSTGGQVWQFTNGQVESVKVSGPLRANNSQMLREAALNGLGIILMPSWLVGDDIRAGRLVQVLGQWRAGIDNDDESVHALYLPTRRGSKKVRAFIDFLAEQFGDPPYWECRGTQG